MNLGSLVERVARRAAALTLVPGVTFEEAKSRAGVPLADWKFASKGVRVKSQPGARSFLYWVVYGQTASSHVFVLILRKGEWYVPESETNYEADCEMIVQAYPLTQDLTTLLPRAFKSLLTSLEGPVPAPKKFGVWPQGAGLTGREIERAENGSAVSLKDAMAGAGLVSKAEGQKTQIEIWVEYLDAAALRLNRQVRQGERPSVGEWEYYHVYVAVDGKEYILSEKSSKTLFEGGFLRGVLGYGYRGKKNLTRLRSGLFAAPEGLRILAEGLVGESPALISSIDRATHEWESGKMASTDGFARRVARAHFEASYNRGLVALTMDQAKRILGFPPNTFPSPDEVKKNYRQKALENHPDRNPSDQAGAEARMKDVNQAKDILDGKQAPDGVRGPGSWSRPSNPDPPPPPRPRWEPPKYTKKEGPDFAEALRKANVPHATWKFISARTWSSSDTLADIDGASVQFGYSYSILYGQTATNHVFVFLVYLNGKVDGIRAIDYASFWKASAESYPLSQDIAKLAPKAIKSLLTSGLVGPKAPKAPTRYLLWPEGEPLTEALVLKMYSRGIPLKDVLIGAGLISSTSEDVADRKTQVEMWGKVNRDKAQEAREKLRRNEVKFVESWSYYDIFVSVNGKQYQLADDTVVNLAKNHFISGVFGYDLDQRKNLTKLRGGTLKFKAATALRLLADALTSEPTALVLGLLKAAEDWEDKPAKTAAYRALVAAEGLQDAALWTGLPLFDLFHAAFGQP